MHLRAIAEGALVVFAPTTHLTRLDASAEMVLTADDLRIADAAGVAAVIVVDEVAVIAALAALQHPPVAAARSYAGVAARILVDVITVIAGLIAGLAGQ